MLVLSLSGAVLVARRSGGWRHWFARLRGPLAGRLHVEIARIAVVGLVLSSMTALWMTASTFDLLPDEGAMPAAPAEVSGETGFALNRMATLQQTPVAELRELIANGTFAPGDKLPSENELIKRYAVSGRATINSEEPLFEDPVALAILIDIFSERGFRANVDIHHLEIPERVDLKTGMIETRRKRVYRMTVFFAGSKIRRG